MFESQINSTEMGNPTAVTFFKDQDKIAHNDDESQKSEQGNVDFEEFLDRMKINKEEFDIESLQKEAEKNTDFFKTLNNMTRRVKCFNQSFGSKLPIFEQKYLEKKLRSKSLSQ